MHDTYLDVRGADEVLDAVRRRMGFGRPPALPAAGVSGLASPV